MDDAALRALVRDVPDFPEPGIVFKDLTPLLANAPALRDVVLRVAAAADGAGVDVVAGVEARGFVLAAPVALELGVGFIPLRKPGKLPWQTVRRGYDLEYGADALEVHVDAAAAGHRLLIVDDVLATGGTAAAACALVEALGAEVAGVAVVVELAFLGGRSKLGNHPLSSVLVYS